MKGHLLEVKDLRTSFFTAEGEIKAVDGISYHVDAGEVVAIVGESGCGKSVAQMSLFQLIPSPPGKILGGEAYLMGQNLFDYKPKSAALRKVRGAQMSMIFQEPMTSLNPVLRVGTQLSEVIRVHTQVSQKDAWAQGVKALKTVGISDAEARMRNYPFELSGGMRQRVMIATAVACNAKLIVADEPTTALDVTTQAQVMELLIDLVEKHNTALVIITHNLGLVTRYAKRVYVMYAGKIVESGTTEQLLTRPKHPYTIGLLNSVPRLEDSTKSDLIPIQGIPPMLRDLPNRCIFFPRCPFATEECEKKPFPQMRCTGEEGHFAACHIGVNGGEGQ